MQFGKRRPDHHILNHPAPEPSAFCRPLSFISPCKLIYLLLFLAHLALVWWLPYFPTQDGPSHIYNLVVLKDLLNGGHIWGDFYYADIKAIPNLGFHIIAYPLLSLFSPAATEKIFVSIYIALMAFSVPFFIRSFNRPVFPFALLIFPVMFNFNLIMGFYSYVIAVPLYLIVFSLCVRSRTRSSVYRFMLYNLFGLLIYYMHLIAFGLFMLSLACMEITAGTLRERFNRLFNLTLLTFPVLANMFVYLLSKHNGLHSKAPLIEQLSNINFAGNLQELMTLSTVTLSKWQIAPAYALFFVFTFYFLLALTSKQSKQSASSNVDTQNALVLLLLLLIIVCLFAPFRFGGGSFFNERFPWIILLISLPLLNSSLERISLFLSATLTTSLAIIFLICNSLIFNEKAVIISTYLEALNLELLSRQYIAGHKRFGNDEDIFRADYLFHAVSYYSAQKQMVNAGNYEAPTVFFPVQVKRQRPLLPSSDQISYEVETIDWQRFPAISHIFAWRLKNTDGKDISRFYDKIFDNRLLSVWRRK